MSTTEQTDDTYLFLEGNFAPVAEEVTAFDLEVTGAVPPALEGRYVRTGPNPLNADPSNHHWFTGDGMVHGVRLSGGRAEWYRNRYVRSPQVSEALGEAPVSLAEGGLLPGFGNTNIVHHGGTMLALMELSLPYEIGPELDTVGTTNFGGELPAGINAHPKFDPDTNDLHVMAYSFVPPFLRYHVVGADGVLRRTTELELGGPVMVHDMAMSDTRVVAFDLPVVFNLEAAMAGKALPYRWDPDYTPRIGVLPRAGTAADTTWIEVEPCYVYHPLNAYDDGDRLIMDLVVHPRAFDDPEHGDPSQGEPTLQRWTVDVAAGRVRTEVIDDRGQEFPRADERLAGRRHRYGYSLGSPSFASLGGLDPDGSTAVLKHDLVAGVTTSHDLGRDRVGSEFVFVPAAEDAGEDEGWLLGYVFDKPSGRSELLILDASDLAADPVARVHLPVRVPQGFHGNWVPDRALS